MKINEICIGDKVKASSRRRIYTVVEISDKGQVMLKSNTGYHDMNISDLRPIKLSPYILEKNGFETWPCGDLITCWKAVGKDGDDDLEVDFEKGKYIKVKFDIVGMYISTQKIQYVHQLQHLMRLCGLPELEI